MISVTPPPTDAAKMVQSVQGQPTTPIALTKAQGPFDFLILYKGGSEVLKKALVLDRPGGLMFHFPDEPGRIVMYFHSNLLKIETIPPRVKEIKTDETEGGAKVIDIDKMIKDKMDDYDRKQKYGKADQFPVGHY